MTQRTPKCTLYSVAKQKGFFELDTYQITKLEDDEDAHIFGNTTYDVEHNPKTDTWTCNCPGFTYHRTPTARDKRLHKHFHIVRFYVEHIKKFLNGEHPDAGIFIEVRGNADMRVVTNPFT